MTALTTTSFSYEDVLEYLERDFLPSLSSREEESASIAATPLRQKRVGRAELTRAAAIPNNADQVDEALNELSSKLSPNLEAMIVSSGEGSFTLRAKTAESLLEILLRCMDSILCLTSSRQSKLSSLQLCLVMTNRAVGDMERTTQTPNPSLMKLRLKLNQTIAKVYRHLEKVPSTRMLSDLHMNIYSNCFRSCLTYFSQMMLLSSRSGSSSAVLEELYGDFEDYRIVESIIFQSRPDGRNQPISPADSCALLDFFSLLASCGHSGLLSFLVDSEIAPLLNEMLRGASKRTSHTAKTGFFAGLSHQVRGYRIAATTASISGVAPKVSWELDQRHENCIRVFRFLAVSVRAADELYSRSPKDKALKKKFFDRALYCIQSNEASIEECLLQVSRATMSESTTAQPSHGHLGRKGLTMQVLREASAIFALLTELCDGDEDIFYQRYAKLYSTMVELARQVVLSTSCFLGASAMARELFQNLTDMEKGNGGSASANIVGETRLGLSPVIDVFAASGRSNTRHEAIQFSHFVSGCSTPVSTSEEERKLKYPDAWKQNVVVQGNADPRQPPELTESSLEQNSRTAITNEFEFALEREACQCLFHAASMMWSTHPASTSFVEFTPEEIASIRNDISWVKARDIVAFRMDDSRHPVRALGEVLYVDTVNLCVHVRVIGSADIHRPVSVPLHRLTGVEDRTKRQGTMAFAPAPETSAVLKKSRRELSIGHLVFAMRWCHEFEHEEKLQGRTGESPWIRMSAEVLGLLVAKEVSLHRESTNPHTSPEQSRMFKAQLLDLFGKEDEYSRFSNPDYGGANMLRTKGRLNDLLPPDLLAAVRQHLGNELMEAIDQILAIQEAHKQQATLHHNRYASPALADVRWYGQRG